MAGPQRVTIDDDLTIDATPEQDYAGEVETTDHPIEDGANPTDHARAKPETFTATCVVSSVPVDENDRAQRGRFERYASGGYARGVYSRMKRMKDDRQLHTIVTPLRRYENMLLTSLSSPSRAPYGDGVLFKVAFKEIRIVSSGTAQLARPAKTSTDKPTKKEQQAKKQPTQAEQRKTALDRLAHATGLLQ